MSGYESTWSRGTVMTPRRESRLDTPRAVDVVAGRELMETLRTQFGAVETIAPATEEKLGRLALDEVDGSVEGI